MFVIADNTLPSPAYFVKQTPVGASVSYALRDAMLFKTWKEASEFLNKEVKSNKLKFKPHQLGIIS